MPITRDLLPLHRVAVLATVDLVDTVTPDDLARPTPCAGWDLADLLAHMTVQHRGFAAAARGDGDEIRIWDPATVADAVAAGPGGTYAASATDVLDAFGVDGVLDASFALPEFGPGATFPGARAIGFHFIDYVVHGWDVARSLGIAFDLPSEVVAAVLPLALAVPDDDRRGAGAPFMPAVPGNGEVSDLDRILAHLGRSPTWPSPARVSC